MTTIYKVSYKKLNEREDGTLVPTDNPRLMATWNEEFFFDKAEATSRFEELKAIKKAIPEKRAEAEAAGLKVFGYARFCESYLTCIKLTEAQIR